MLTTIIHLKVEITTQPDNTMKQRGGERRAERPTMHWSIK
jgi:hypothetical protein